MSIYSCLADAARLGALSQGVDLAAALPAASDWKFDVPTAAGFVVGSVVTGLGLYLLVSLYFQLRYYRAHATHDREFPDYDPFTGHLGMVRVTLPEREPRAVTTMIGTRLAIDSVIPPSSAITVKRPSPRLISFGRLKRTRPSPSSSVRS